MKKKIHTTLKRKLAIAANELQVFTRENSRAIMEAHNYEIKGIHLFINNEARDIRLSRLQVVANCLGLDINYLVDDNIKPQHGMAKRNF